MGRVLALPSLPWPGLMRAARLALLVAGITALALAWPIHRAQAQANPGISERDVQARRLFEQGREAYSDGRYRDAWAYFHEAYQLSGRPELLFNIGQTADRLGQEGDALRAFSMYLERLPTAPNRKDVENRVRALRDRLEASQQAQSHPPPTAAAARPAPKPDPAHPATPPAALARQQPLPTPPEITKPPREPRRGFLLRAAIGVGYRSDAINTSNTFDGIELTGSTNGFGLALDLGIGWGVLPGFAIGGGVFMDWASSPTLAADGGGETKLSFSRLTTIGPFIDWYPVRKTLGLYILGAFGLSVLAYKSAAEGMEAFEGDAYGFGFTLGTGYDFSLSRTVGLGIELRFMTAILGEAVANETTSHVITAPSLLASLTWF
jgi:hypothetical protein